MWTMFRLAVTVYALLAVGCDGSALKRQKEDLDDWEGIVGGVPASLGEFPSQVSLLSRNGHFCGASILNKEWVLTAAHCVRNADVNGVTILAGTIDIGSGEGTRHPASKIIYHRNYNENTLSNDIAVIKVSVPFELDGFLRAPVKLPEQDQATADGATTTIVGWGRLSEGGPIPRRLQKVNTLILNHEKCKTIYNALGFKVFPSQVCSTVPQGGAGACKGDSGGPVFVDGVIVGIVSWSRGCAVRDNPSVDTRVASFRDWIDRNTAV